MSKKLVRSTCQRAYNARKRHRRVALWERWLVAILLLVFAGSGLAQLTGKGAITGTVTDPSGAVIPGASVAATNKDTGITTSTVSTGTGSFTFANLDPGIYAVT